MNPLNFLAAMVVAVVIFLIYEAWHYLAGKTASDAAQLIPVDLEAFENLMDPEEERFLKMSLSGAEFRSVQRARLRAARMYVQALRQNAGVLMAAGQSARSEPDLAATGQEIMEKALRLKLWCAATQVRLSAAMAFPGILSPTGRIADQYVAVTSMAESLRRKALA